MDLAITKGGLGLQFGVARDPHGAIFQFPGRSFAAWSYPEIEVGAIEKNGGIAGCIAEFLARGNHHGVRAFGIMHAPFLSGEFWGVVATWTGGWILQEEWGGEDEQE